MSLPLITIVPSLFIVMLADPVVSVIESFAVIARVLPTLSESVPVMEMPGSSRPIPSDRQSPSAIRPWRHSLSGRRRS